MKALLASLFFVFVTQAVADERIGQVCYDQLGSRTQFCTQDNVGSKVQVLIYNAGWCSPCNDEMDELGDIYPEFQNSAVVFASLSGEGYSHGAKPDQAFLQSWKTKHNIKFTVAGKYKDFGGIFGNPGSIPFAVIVDKAGTISSSGYMSASQIASKVRALLAQDE